MEESFLHRSRDLGTLLRIRAEQDGERTIAFCKDDSLTLRDLNEGSDCVASYLVSMGLRKGERVGIISHSCLDYLVAEFGIWKCGLICVPLNCNLKAQELGFLRSNSGLALSFVHRDYLEEYLKSNEAKPTPYFVFGSDEEENSFSKLTKTSSRSEIRVGDGDTACIMYTSGTTGSPKGVIYEHYGLYPFHNETYVQQMMEIIGLSENDTTYLPFPLYHILGQVHLIGALRNGGRIALAERFSASRFWDEVRKYNATVLVHQGASIPLLLKQPSSSKDREHRARISVGAGVPNIKAWKEFEERFAVKIYEHYAQTEGSFFGAGTIPTNRLGSIGREFPSAEVRLINDRGEDVPDGSPGQLISRLKTENARKKPQELYFGEPERGASRFTDDGWFKSGDILERDSDGYYHYVGKVETYIRYRGENISPLQIESVLALNSQIDESIAVAVPNREFGGDDIKIVLVPKNGLKIDPEVVYRWCEERLSKFMLPRFIEIVPELKKSEQTKKVLRNEYTTNTLGVWDRLSKDAS